MSARTPRTTGQAVAAPAIELFQREDDPGSHAVRRRLTALGLDFIAHNVSDEHPFKHEQLVQIGGKDQIPFLFDHKTGTKLYESSAIVAFLDSHYGIEAETRLGRIARRLGSQLETRRDRLAWAVRMPVEKASALRGDLRDAWETLRGSLRFAKDVAKKAGSAA